MDTNKSGSRSSRTWLICLLALLVCTGPALADKTDIIHLHNGDRITGEIKSLDRGRLQVSTDGMGTIYINWVDVHWISSPARFIVELEDGTRFEGTLAGDEAGSGLLVQGQEPDKESADGQLVDMASVVWIDQLKLDATRIERWDGSVSLGFDATRANNRTSLSASAAASRRAEDFVLSLSSSVYYTAQDEAEDTLTANFDAVYRGLLEERWFWAGLGALERNDQLGIDLRTIAGAGYGRFLVQSGRSLWSVTGGLVVTNEQRAGNEAAGNNLEAFFNTDFEFFTYDTPKTTLSTVLTVFPGITDSGRIRAKLDFELRRELIKDLFIQLSFYDSYDSRPPEEGTQNDYGVVTSLGYSY